MLLSNPKIEYSSVRRMPSVKSSGQTQGTTTNAMPTSTSLQDISSHHTQKFTWNNNNNNQDQRLVSLSDKILGTNIGGRQISTSQSDERIFEHPEVTIIPSVLDDEIQRRLLTMKSSNTSDHLLHDGGRSAPNILEHPDMRAPVVMQSQQIPSSLSSSALLFQNDTKQISRTNSNDVSSATVRTPSPKNSVDFFIDNQQKSTSPGLLTNDTIENPQFEKNENKYSIITTTTTDFHSSSKSTIKTKKNDSW